jgi:PAS domain S-box-containing protein
MHLDPSGEKSGLAAYFAGTLRLRGRVRIVATVAIAAVDLAIAATMILVVGTATNSPVAVCAIAFGWLWGRRIGAAVGFTSALLNTAVAGAAGAGNGITALAVIDAVAIAAVATAFGHIRVVFERAIGAHALTQRAFTELEQSARDRMLTITDGVPVGLYRTTPDGRIVGGNEALMAILGFPDMETMLQANVWDLYVDPSDRQRQFEADEDDDRPWREFELRRADGTVIWARDWAHVVRDASGVITHFDGVVEDITMQRAADERFRAAFEDSPIGMTISAVDGRIIRANAAAAALLGRNDDELQGLHFSAYTAEEDIEMTETALGDVKAGKVARYEKRLMRPDGSSIWALVNLAPIHSIGDDPTIFLSQVIDMTERRRAQEALEALIRSKDELIASVSHELRTPLTVVHGLAQELDTRWITFAPSEQKEFIALIAQHSAEVAYIVEDLLAAARADTGKLPIFADTMDVASEIESARTAVPAFPVEVRRVGDAIPIAFADPARVRQIVRNLVSNADRYGGDKVSITYGVADQRIWIEVADNGAGVPEHDADRVFDAYHRAHNAAGQPASVGLGLTVSRRLAELMGGDLTYRYEDGNAVFRLELPAAGAVHGMAPRPFGETVAH